MILKKFFLRAVPIYLAIAGGIFLFYGCHRGGHGGDPHQMATHIVKMMTKKLHLTTDQTTQAQQIADEIADTLVARHKNHPQGWQPEIVKQLRATAVDTAALSQSLVQRQARQAELHGFMMMKFVQFHDLLTPDQRDTLAAFIEKHAHGMWGGDHGKRGHGAYGHRDWGSKGGDSAQ